MSKYLKKGRNKYLNILEKLTPPWTICEYIQKVEIFTNKYSKCLRPKFEQILDIFMAKVKNLKNMHLKYDILAKSGTKINFNICNYILIIRQILKYQKCNSKNSKTNIYLRHTIFKHGNIYAHPCDIVIVYVYKWRT